MIWNSDVAFLFNTIELNSHFIKKKKFSSKNINFLNFLTEIYNLINTKNSSDMKWRWILLFADLFHKYRLLSQVNVDHLPLDELCVDAKEKQIMLFIRLDYILSCFGVRALNKELRVFK